MNPTWKFCSCLFLVVSVVLVVCAASVAVVGEEPESQWGQPKAGLQISLSIKDGLNADGVFPVRVALRNAADGAVALPKPHPSSSAIFGVLILQQGDKRFFTSRIFIGGSDVKLLPKELPAGKCINVLCRGLSTKQTYLYSKGVKFLDAYKAGRKLKTAPAGPVGKVLEPGPAFGWFLLYIKPPGGAEMLLKSNHVQFTVATPNFAKLSDEAKREFTRKLLAKFDRDAWSAKSAHSTAVKIGKPLVPDMIAAAKQRSRPAYSRMWLTTAVCDIRDESCTEALIKLLADPTVQTIVAYHGPKQHSGKLDAAIIARAREMKTTRFTAYALLGFLAFRRESPPELLKLGLDSPDPRCRAAAVESLKRIGGGPATLEALTKRLKDADPRVRAAAARVLGYIDNRSPRVVGALVAALKMPGDVARQRICTALEQLTGRAMPYPATGTAAEKQQVIQYWQQWWKSRQVIDE
jgi:hypothetical protein